MSEISGNVVPVQARPKAPQVGPRPLPAAKPRRSRRRILIVSFLLAVVLPVVVAGWYLYAIAADQYASRVGFVVREADKTVVPSMDLLGGLSTFGSGSTTDATILYEYIQSDQLVDQVDRKLDLRRIFGVPRHDPVFAFDPAGSLEDLRSYWSRMVRISLDNSTGILDLRVLAFSPEDARMIAREILDASTIKINEMNAAARKDATRYAREDLDKAMDFLKATRQAMTAFRGRTQIVDPSADMQVQTGLIGNLQGQLANSLIELDMLRESTKPDDPRVRQAEQRITVIEQRIDAERKKISASGGEGGEAFADVVAEYESLAVDLDFAQKAYVSALAAYDLAAAEANRQSRYLATFVEPTLAHSSEYPERPTILALIALFAFLIWVTGVLFAYSAWDRR